MKRALVGAALAVVACGPPAAPTQPNEAASPDPPAEVASSAPATPPPAAECPRAMATELPAIRAEVECLLQEYVRLDTTNPPGNEIVAARFLERVLGREGIPSQIVESAPGRANLIARVRGREPGHALMLVHHMDVVPASPAEWRVPPFSGTLQGGYVWGRGSLDDKGMGVAHLVTLAILARLGMVPAHDVVLLGVADEESGGGQGVRWLLEHQRAWFQGVEFVLNEGGAILEFAPGQLVYGVELAQKAPLWLKLTARGVSGHGSAPADNTATAVLVRALARLAQHRFPIVVIPEVQAMFAARTASLPEAQRAPFRDLGRSLKDPKFQKKFLENPRDAAMVRNTLAITMLSGSDKENVISERASAVLDIRLLPGQEATAVTDALKRVMAEPSIEVESLLGWTARSSPRDTPLFSAIERLARARHPGAPVTANVIGGFTDCNAFRTENIVCYGFHPMRVKLDELHAIHGKDERIDTTALAESVLGLHELLRELWVLPPSAPR